MDRKSWKSLVKMASNTHSQRIPWRLMMMMMMMMMISVDFLRQLLSMPLNMALSEAFNSVSGMT